MLVKRCLFIAPLLFILLLPVKASLSGDVHTYTKKETESRQATFIDIFKLARKYHPSNHIVLNDVINLYAMSCCSKKAEVIELLKHNNFKIHNVDPQRYSKFKLFDNQYNSIISGSRQAHFWNPFVEYKAIFFFKDDKLIGARGSATQTVL